jgi:hypothetical protein
MSHIHWVVRQNKLEIPRDKDEVNKREIHECDGRAHDPDTMVAPLTSKSTHKVQTLTRTTSTIPSCREEDTELRKWSSPLYCLFVLPDFFSCAVQEYRRIGND